MRQRVGRWTPDEDTLGPRTGRKWLNLCQVVLKCRVESGESTEEEDLMLEAVLDEHGFSCSKVAAALPAWTDNPVLEMKYLCFKLAHKKMQNVAFISNFVDQEQERPALGPNDFMPLALTCDNQKTSKSHRPRNKTQACSENVLDITYGDETETSNQHDVIPKKKIVKPHSGKKKVNSEPNTGKKVSKRRSKMPSYAELDEMSIYFPPPESLVPETTYGDNSKTPCGNNDVSNSNRRDPNWNFANNLCSISCQEQDASCCSEVGILSGTIDDIELIRNHSDYLDSTLSSIIDNVEGDVPGGIDAFMKKRPLKLPPKKKLCMKLGNERNGGENMSLESIREAVKQNNKRKRCNEPSEERQDVASISYQQDGCKRSEASSRSYSEHFLEASDGEDVTLACFLRNELKKRKLKAAEAGSSSESLLLSKPVDKHSNEDQMPADMQNGKAEIYTNGGTLRWTSDETDEH
ncbi:hypothetical protein Pint_16994 [Pistacia integerrima]|uniref:Uncharacterized protein n=1 Tax=Pistacia integerrima TaxID=434235 RepID=A0ACC0ZFA8_9ROSI|nr:hypothetical protein Pint_16994 [Pistacia integerrima]